MRMQFAGAVLQATHPGPDRPIRTAALGRQGRQVTSKARAHTMKSEATSVIRFEGSGALASLVADQLKRVGATGEYEPPDEQRGIGQVAAPIVEMVVAGLTVEGIKTAIKSLTATL